VCWQVSCCAAALSDAVCQTAAALPTHRSVRFTEPQSCTPAARRPMLRLQVQPACAAVPAAQCVPAADLHQLADRHAC
jgi:hypothetical protein